MSHATSATSIRDLVHFGQMYKYQITARFDYGSPEANMKQNNRTTPPEYDISRVNTPVTLYYGGNDWLADSQVRLLSMFCKYDPIITSQITDAGWRD